MSTLTTPTQMSLYAVAVLKGQLKLLSVGLSIRGLSKTKALKQATKITGVTYKRGEQIKAAADLQDILDEVLT